MVPGPSDLVRMPHCAVCLSSWGETHSCARRGGCGTSVCRLPCGHLFHTECAREWLRKKNSCPMCRAPVAEEEDPILQPMWRLRVSGDRGWNRETDSNYPATSHFESSGSQRSHPRTPSWAGAVSRALPQRTLGLVRSRVLSTVASHSRSRSGPRPVRQNPFLEPGMNPYLQDPLPTVPILRGQEDPLHRYSAVRRPARRSR